jgi:hypothetical protein
MGDSGMKLFFALFLCLFCLAGAGHAEANYTYAHNDAEYSVTLPEAPTVETIWADATHIPYLEKPPTVGALGEVATFKRVDIQTGEQFEVTITFLRASHDFLDGLTEEKIKAAIEKDIKSEHLTGQKFAFSTGKGALKWATMTGFMPDKGKHPTYREEHYLTGLQSILVIKIKYNVENETFQGYYKTLTDSITYHAP